jgi:hypothetical protein
VSISLRGLVPRLLPLEDALSPTKLDNGHVLCAKGSTPTSRTSSSSSVVSIRSARGIYSSFPKQGEQICKDLEQGYCIHVQTSAIDLQFSWSSDRSGVAARPVKGAECYRIRIESLKKNTALLTIHGRWTSNVYDAIKTRWSGSIALQVLVALFATTEGVDSS